MTDKSLDLEKALAMAAGQDMEKFYNAQIADGDKQLLRDALENIFQGKSIIEWANGGNLQHAWNTSLDDMRDEFFATSRRDILTVTLQRLVFEHRNKWHEKIRINDNRLQIMCDTIDKNTIPELLEHAEFQKQQGYDVIKKIFEKYDNGFKPVQLKTQDTCVLNMVHERKLEREHEYVRERVK